MPKTRTVILNNCSLYEILLRISIGITYIPLLFHTLFQLASALHKGRLKTVLHNETLNLKLFRYSTTVQDNDDTTVRSSCLDKTVQLLQYTIVL